MQVSPDSSLLSCQENIGSQIIIYKTENFDLEIQ